MSQLQYYVYNTQLKLELILQSTIMLAVPLLEKAEPGGKGGAGADGCIILYYGVTTPVQDGQLKDKNGLMRWTSTGRRLIV